MDPYQYFEVDQNGNYRFDNNNINNGMTTLRDTYTNDSSVVNNIDLSVIHSQPIQSMPILVPYGYGQCMPIMNTIGTSPTRTCFSDSSESGMNMSSPYVSEEHLLGDRRQHDGKAKNFASRKPRITLPPWTLNHNYEIKSTITLEDVVSNGLVKCFAMDKAGCHFLQSRFYGNDGREVEPHLRRKIYKDIVENRETFLTLAKNIFGNFFLQRVIENAFDNEQELIRMHISSNILSLCLDKSGCRVVQTALDKLNNKQTARLVESLPRTSDLMTICVDQNANHVIQKIVKKMPLKRWEFLIDFFWKKTEDNLLRVCKDKYGCRVVQTVIEVLSQEFVSKEEKSEKCRALYRLMMRIMHNCHILASNEFANYIIQHIIQTPGVLEEYRNTLIEKCLLRNLLSLSQEKYASHVVERALAFAPPSHLIEMMEEIFDGYVPHPDSGKDAVDILIFHQFGNYVVQGMLSICRAVVRGTRNVRVNGEEKREKFEDWLIILYMRAMKDKAKLMRFSSGKKIIEMFETIESKFEMTALSKKMIQLNMLSAHSNRSEWRSSKSSLSSYDNINAELDMIYHSIEN